MDADDAGDKNFWEDEDSGDITDFDQEEAASYVGKYILIGITYLDHYKNFIEQVQKHGVIKSATLDGIEVELKGKEEGETITLPPDLSGISAAEPGIYATKQTHEVIENPDFVSSWTVTKPPTEH